jgi:glycosyltransferase involved in cell wall biosynthesis
MKESPKWVAMVGYTFYASDERLKRHVSALKELGLCVDVISLVDPRGVRERDEADLNFYLPRTRRFERQGKFQVIGEYVLFTFLSTFMLLRNHFFRHRYSLVHINNMPNFLIVAALPLKLLGVPVLLDIHDTMPEIYQDRFGVSAEHWMVRGLLLEERLCMRLADFVITTEHTKLERLLENGLRPEKAAVTLNLADAGLFPMPDIPEAQPPAVDFRIVYHGTLTHRLGMDIAVRAIAKITNAVPQVRLEITGDGEQRDELVNLSRRMSLEKHIHFSDGFVPTEELPGILAGAALAVVPSRKNVATKLMLPVKLLEYVRLGVPTITVATHTITRYFQDTMVRFVPPDDPDALAEQIVYLYQNPQERLGMARSARRFFETYTFESERRRYQEIIRRLIGQATADPEHAGAQPS